MTAVPTSPELGRRVHAGHAVGSISALPRPVAERLLAGLLDLVYRA